jgi:hypothetical protein
MKNTPSRKKQQAATGYRHYGIPEVRVIVQLTPNEPKHIPIYPRLEVKNKPIESIGLLKQPPDHIDGHTPKNQQNLPFPTFHYLLHSISIFLISPLGR